MEQNEGGLKLNFGNLEGLNSKEESQTVDFSWENEFAEIGGKKVASYEILEQNDAIACKAKVVTLEKDSFELDCSIHAGIKVTKTNLEDFKGKVYESLESLLMRASPLYIKSFNSGIHDEED